MKVLLAVVALLTPLLSPDVRQALSGMLADLIEGWRKKRRQRLGKDISDEHRV